MKRKATALLLAGAAALMGTNQAMADSITKPYTFSDGTPASGPEVNADFDTVYDQINKMGSMITVDNINGRVGIGTETPTDTLNVTGGITIETEGKGIFSAIRYTDTTSGGVFLGRKARGTILAPTAVLNGDSLASFGGYGYAATGWPAKPGPSSRGMMTISAAEDWTDTAQGAYITFGTAANGTTAKTERVRISDAGLVGIGTTAPESMLDVVSDYAVTSRPSMIHLTTYRDGVAGSPSGIKGRRARGSMEYPAALQNGDYIFSVSGMGYRGDTAGWGNERYSATMQFRATENFTDTATGTSIRFRSTPNGSTIAQDRMLIDQNGNVGIGTTAPIAKLAIDGIDIQYDVGVCPEGYMEGDFDGQGDTLDCKQYAMVVNESNIFLGNSGQMPPLDPSEKLHVEGKITVMDGIEVGDMNAVNALDVFGYAGVSISNSTSYSRASVPGGNLIVQNQVGIGTTTPQATLDINGFMKMAKNVSEPVTCDANQDGSLALTSGYRMCVCDGDATTWVYTSDGSTPCSW
jgi:hypothetical protein